MGACWADDSKLLLLLNSKPIDLQIRWVSCIIMNLMSLVTQLQFCCVFICTTHSKTLIEYIGILF